SPAVPGLPGRGVQHRQVAGAPHRLRPVAAGLVGALLGLPAHGPDGGLAGVAPGTRKPSRRSPATDHVRLPPPAPPTMAPPGRQLGSRTAVRRRHHRPLVRGFGFGGGSTERAGRSRVPAGAAGLLAGGLVRPDGLGWPHLGHSPGPEVPGGLGLRPDHRGLRGILDDPLHYRRLALVVLAGGGLRGRRGHEPGGAGPERAGGGRRGGAGTGHHHGTVWISPVPRCCRRAAPLFRPQSKPKGRSRLALAGHGRHGPGQRPAVRPGCKEGCPEKGHFLRTTVGWGREWAVGRAQPPWASRTARSAASKPILLWVPSQKGFLVEPPQRHKKNVSFVLSWVQTASTKTAGPSTL